MLQITRKVEPSQVIRAIRVEFADGTQRTLRLKPPERLSGIFLDPPNGTDWTLSSETLSTGDLFRCGSMLEQVPGPCVYRFECAVELDMSRPGTSRNYSDLFLRLL